MTVTGRVGSGLHRRTQGDLAARRAVFAGERAIHVPADGIDFWRWYAHFLRPGHEVELRSGNGYDDGFAMPYPEPVKGPALWFSGGVESTYTRIVLQQSGISPVLLRIEDFPVFTGPDRSVGQIHFLCAAVAAGLGHGPIYLGMERNDLLLGSDAFSRGYLERHPQFALQWSLYQPAHPVVTVCGDLHKEQMIARLHELGVAVTGTCDRLTGGAWCGDCYKCFEAFYSAKAVDVDLGIALRRTAFDRYHGEYRRYVESGFTDNVNNAYQHYVRLQISYGLRFEPRRDCGGESR